MSIDIVTILGAAMAIITVVTPFIAKYYYQMSLYLTVIKQFMDIISTYITASKDGKYEDSEKIALADKIILLGQFVNSNKLIPAFFKVRQKHLYKDNKSHNSR
mgnify:CR=1 FL=1